MGVLNDYEIRQRSLYYGMIAPFEEGVKRPGVVSYGVSSYGYDFRIGYEFDLFTPSHSPPIIDPKNFDSGVAEKVDAREVGYIDLPPHSFALGVTVEYFRIPRDIITICLGKSTYARCGLSILVTPFEPEWEGYATVELSNPTPRPLRVYAGEGIGQLLFFQAGVNFDLLEADLGEFARANGLSRVPSLFACRMMCDVSYRDKAGKYQGQFNEVVYPKVD